MSTIASRKLDYPTSDGKPMAETDLHRMLMVELIDSLKIHFAEDPQIYVSGNLLLFYEEGNRRKHVSPDVFVVFGVENRARENYLLWQEGKGPEVVIELTSSSTRNEDVKTKFNLYRDVLKVREYFLFDPNEDFLDPPMRGYSLIDGEYAPIELQSGRLPSAVLGLQLERVDSTLRLYDPNTGKWLMTREEITSAERLARRQAEAAKDKAEADLRQEALARQQETLARQQEAQARQQAEAAKEMAEAAREKAEADSRQEALARQQEKAAREKAEAEMERMRLELAELRRKA